MHAFLFYVDYYVHMNTIFQIHMAEIQSNEQ